MVGGGPPELGFDYSFTLPCGIQGPVYTAYENGNWYPLGKDSRIVYLDEQTVADPGYLSSKGPGMGDSNWDPRDLGKRLAAKAVDFIDAHAGRKPFFLCYWSPMVHLPHCPPDEFDGVPVKGTTPTAHLDMIRDLDLQVARIVSALKKNGVYDNTLIVFTSDNGGLYVAASLKAGHNPNGGWRGSKNAAYEGGHRVPFIATWPAGITAGRVSDEPVATHDMLATMAALLKQDVPADEALDSLNLLPLLTGQAGFVARESLVLQAGSRYEIMFRVGDWKLILQSDHPVTKFEPIALFNLAENPREQESRNLVNDPAQRERVQTMRQRYLAIRHGKQRTTPPLTFAGGGADKAGLKKQPAR